MAGSGFLLQATPEHNAKSLALKVASLVNEFECLIRGIFVSVDLILHGALLGRRGDTPHHVEEVRSLRGQHRLQN